MKQIKKTINIIYAQKFTELVLSIKKQGLFDKKVVHSLWKFFLVGFLLAGHIFVLIYFQAFWIQVINAVCFAFTSTQIAFLIHDAGHQQISQSTKTNNLIGQVMVVFSGASYRWWVDKHNRHHSEPNHEELDPDIQIPLVAFSEKQAAEKKGFSKKITQYQSYLFLPMLCLVSLSFRKASLQYMLRHLNEKKGVIDFLIFILHFGLYFTLIFLALQPWWHAVLFIFIHQSLYGFYKGLVFAPNHKGMKMPEKNHQLSFLELQVLTARNIKSNRFIDFMYGGLNFQIEHHLFPYMPRRYYRKVQKKVKTLCKELNLSYHDVGFLRAWKEILSHLHQISGAVKI